MEEANKNIVEELELLKIESPKNMADFVIRKMRVRRKNKKGELKEYNYEVKIPRRVYKRDNQPKILVGRPKFARCLINDLCSKLSYADHIEILNKLCKDYFSNETERIELKDGIDDLKGYYIITTKDGIQSAQAVSDKAISNRISPAETTCGDIVRADNIIEKIADGFREPLNTLKEVDDIIDNIAHGGND